MLIFQKILERSAVISTCSFMWWNEICSSKFEPINIWRILFAVELGLSHRKSSTDNLVLDVEFLKILNYFSAVYQHI